MQGNVGSSHANNLKYLLYVTTFFPSHHDASLESPTEDLTLYAPFSPQDVEILKYNTYGLSRLLAHTFLITGHIKSKLQY